MNRINRIPRFITLFQTFFVASSSLFLAFERSLLRREILRLGGEAFDASGTSGALGASGASGAGDALEVLDPERPSEDEDETSRDIKGHQGTSRDSNLIPGMNPTVGVEPGLKRHKKWFMISEFVFTIVMKE